MLGKLIKRVWTFSLLSSISVLSIQLHAQENNVGRVQSAEETQLEEEQKLVRVRRAGRPPSTRGVPSTRGTPAPNTRGSLDQLSSRTRDTSPAGRLSTESSRKRSSPTKPKGSPSKLSKVEEKPSPAPLGGIVYAPNAVQHNERYKALSNLEKNYRAPIFIRNSGGKMKEEFKLPWKNSEDGGMEHILKRHTHEYYNGSTPAPQTRK